ncbi:hypothetical protein CUMW_252850 [Citrus unshiu]|uniref:Uncharacterized protein n=1 Tax=Citrus unshiu TaxID=55188 RepID=A0A2H5QQQ1_CITUN|nr:hypothetical protein CUMW_252850 [Citrus unshiu]
MRRKELRNNSTVHIVDQLKDLALQIRSYRKAAHNVILRDLGMLENQIPLFVLRKMLEIQCSSLKSADDMLMSMLKGFCKELSPLKMKDQPMIKISERAHLLNILYDRFVSKAEQKIEITKVDDQGEAMHPEEI